MNPGEAILTQLAAGGGVTARVMIVVAHPDDETIGLGAQLPRLTDALLVQVTDGAPRDGQDARNYGFASVVKYAAARQEELEAALRAGDAGHVRMIGLGVPDKEAWHDLSGLARHIADLLRAERPAAVFTHAYEGGHPDHDTAAFAVHAACRLGADPPCIVEMPFYHRDNGQLIFGRFVESSSRGPSAHGLDPWGKPGLRSWAMRLDGEATRRKQRMVDCFATQRWLLEQFDISTERFRIAPEYDFGEPPHPGELHYESLGWRISGAEWRRAAAEAVERLGLGCHCEERSDA